MRSIYRLPLSESTEAVLSQLQGELNAHEQPRAEVTQAWKRKDSRRSGQAAFEEVRSRLKQMAPGRERCMYCEDSHATDIEHFWPKSAYPEWTFSWNNYLLACPECNSNFKRTQMPTDGAGAPMLLDPTRDEPLDHFDLVPETGYLEPRTQRGRVTAEVLGLNRRQVLRDGRKHTWTRLSELLRNYASAKENGDTLRAERIATTIRCEGFSAVLSFLVRMVKVGLIDACVDPEVARIVDQHGEVSEWARVAELFGR